MSLTDEQKIALADKVIAQKEKQKAYDRWYMAKAKFRQTEMERVIKENGLEGEINEFSQTIEDFRE